MSNMTKEFCQNQRRELSCLEGASDEYILKFKEAEYAMYAATAKQSNKNKKTFKKHKTTVDLSGSHKWKIKNSL